MIRKAKVTFVLMLALIAGAQAASADCGYAEAMKTHWSRMRRMLTAIVAAMPEDKYDFRPVKEVRSFREMVKHMVQDAYSHIGYVAGMSREESEKLTKKYDKIGTRAEFLKAMGESYDYGDKILGTITDKNAMDLVAGMRGEKMTRVEAAQVAFEDQMDHYGNLVVYLRINGVVPPDTSGADADRKRNAEQGKGGAMEEHNH